MARTCPSCGTQNPDEARFCFACATPVVAGFEGRRERKFATALFADIVGSTSLGEREDPEVVRALIERTFERLSQHVLAFGGTLERFMGDGVLAVFGVPAAHEDDPERAVRAGLAMLDDVAALAADLEREGRPAIQIRVGVEAGEVLVDLDRASATHDRMLTGDAVNVAARLQSVAEPGALIVGPSVHEATVSAVDYQPLPPLTLKGKAESVAAWRAVRAHPGSRRRADRGLRARLVGRDEEVALLTSALARSKTERRPVLVTVAGPAGVGKSRLAAEWAVGRTDVARFEGRSVAYGNRSYAGLVEVVEAASGIGDDDPPEVAAGKIDDLALRLGDPSFATPLRALVVGGGTTATREELLDDLVRFVEGLAAERPLLLTFEDVHWADDGLLDLIEQVARRGEGPITLLALTRPELLDRRPGWGSSAPDALTLRLDPLDGAETRAMLADLLRAEPPSGVVDLVLERAEGNPLFAEEIVRALIDRADLVHGDAGWVLKGDPADLDVPRSIQALLAARLDALDEDEKRTLQDAAVLGRTFWADAVVALAGDRDAERCLATLYEKDLIAPVVRGDPTGEGMFAFRHVLIRDVAYDALPKAHRWRKHVDAARWLDGYGSTRGQELAEPIATHLVTALGYLEDLGDTPDEPLLHDASRWATAAARRARSLWQPAAAVRWFRTALDLTARSGVSPLDRARLWEDYGRAGEGVEPYPTVARALEEALQGYVDLGREADAGRVQAWLAWAAYQSGREDDVVPFASSAIARLEPFGDGPDLAMALRILGRYQRRRGNSGVAEATLRRAMEIAERVGDDVSRAWAMVTLGPILRADGGAAGMRLAERGLEIAERTRDLTLIVQAHVDLSEAYEEIVGDYGRAEALMREGLEVARRAGSGANASWLEGNLADYLVDQGRLREAIGPAEHALGVAREVGDKVRIAYCLATCAYIHVLRLHVEEAARMLAEAAEIEGRHPDTYLAGWIPLVGALVARARGRDEESLLTLLAGAEHVGDRAEVWGGSSLQLECVRSLATIDRDEEAIVFRDRLHRMASYSVPGRALLAWADALLTRDQAGRLASFRDAIERLEAIERRVDLGRCLLDAAAAARDADEDDGGSAERGRGLLIDAGAPLFLPVRSASSDADAARAPR